MGLCLNDLTARIGLFCLFKKICFYNWILQKYTKIFILDCCL